MKCQKPIKCWDNTIRYCKRDFGHLDHCNPFSDTVYVYQEGNVSTPKEVKKEESVQSMFDRVLTVARNEWAK